MWSLALLAASCISTVIYNRRYLCDGGWTGRLLGLNAYLLCIHWVVLHSLHCASIGVACLIPTIDHIHSRAAFAAIFPMWSYPFACEIPYFSRCRSLHWTSTQQFKAKVMHEAELNLFISRKLMDGSKQGFEVKKR